MSDVGPRSIVPKQTSRVSWRKVFLAILIMILIGVVIYAGSLAVQAIRYEQKPIEASVAFRSSGEFMTDSGVAKIRLDKGETTKMGTEQVTLLDYDDKGVTLSIPSNEDNESLPYADRPTRFHVNYGQAYIYRHPGKCCGQGFSVHNEIIFHKR